MKLDAQEAKRLRRKARVEGRGADGALAPAPEGMDKAALKGLDDIAKRPVDPGTRIDEPVHPMVGVGHGDRPARQEHVPGVALSGPQDARAVPEPMVATAEGGSRRPPETVGGQPYEAGDVPLAPLHQREAWGTGLHQLTDDDTDVVGARLDQWAGSLRSTPRSGDRAGVPSGGAAAHDTGFQGTASGAPVPARGPRTPATIAAGHGDPTWEAARGGATPVTRTHGWADPISRPDGLGEGGGYVVRSSFDVRRFSHNDEPVTDVTVRVSVSGAEGVGPHEVDALKARAGAAVDRVFNAPGHRLPGGDRFHLTLEFTESVDAHLAVKAVASDVRVDQHSWSVNATEQDLAHEIGHQLGLRDEYRDETAPHRPDIGGSLMGDYHRPPPGGLSQGGLRERHLYLLDALIGDVDQSPSAAAHGIGPTGGIEVAPRAPHGNPAVDQAALNDRAIVDDWERLSALRFGRPSAAFQRVNRAVHDWMDGGRPRPGDLVANRSELHALRDSISAWKETKVDGSARMGAVDRLLAHVEAHLDQLRVVEMERSAQAWSKGVYTQLEPGLGDFAKRRIPERVNAEGNPSHLAFTMDRRADGRLSEGALKILDGVSHDQLAARLDAASSAGISVHGLTDDQVRDLMMAEAHANKLTGASEYPELASYLDRVDHSLTTDTGGRTDMVPPRTENIGGTRVTVHTDPTDSLSVQRWENFRSAVEKVQAAGFDVPPVKLHLPKYGRSLEVGERGIIVKPEVKINRAEYIAPGTVIAGPEVVHNPLLRPGPDGKQHYLSSELDPSGVGTMVHELGHFMHYANSPALYHELSFTEFAGHAVHDGTPVPHRQVAASVSGYAYGNPREFVAEVFTGLVYGRQFDENVLSLYRGLGGAFPPSRHTLTSGASTWGDGVRSEIDRVFGPPGTHGTDGAAPHTAAAPDVSPLHASHGGPVHAKAVSPRAPSSRARGLEEGLGTPRHRTENPLTFVREGVGRPQPRGVAPGRVFRDSTAPEVTEPSAGFTTGTESLHGDAGAAAHGARTDVTTAGKMSDGVDSHAGEGGVDGARSAAHGGAVADAEVHAGEGGVDGARPAAHGGAVADAEVHAGEGSVDGTRSAAHGGAVADAEVHAGEGSVDGARPAAHGGAVADAEVHAVESERLVWVPPTKKEGNADADGTGQWRFVAEPVEGEAHLTWSDWKVAEHGDRQGKSVVVDPRDLSQPDLHHLADLLVRNDQPKEAVSLLDEALRLDQAARRAGPGGRVDQIIWTGREITSMAKKLEDSLDRLAKTPPAELTRVHPDIRAVTDDTERLATALNGYITGAAEVSGVYQLRNRYALLVMMGKRVVSGRAGDSPAEDASELIKIVQQFRRRKAYAEVPTGTQWKKVIVPGGDTRIAELLEKGSDFVKSLSQRNIESLQTATEHLFADDRFKNLYKNLTSLPYRLKHATPAYHAIANSGLLSSQGDLARRDAKFLASGKSSKNNTSNLGNDDFVFFRVEANDKPMATRYGSTTIVFDINVLKRYGGWVSLHDQLEPLDRTAMRELKVDGVPEPVRTSAYPPGATRVGEKHSWIQTYPRTEEPPLTVNVRFDEEVFAGKDFTEGLALSVLREVDRVGGKFRENVLRISDELTLGGPGREEAQLDDLANIVFSMYRPEAKFGSGLPLDTVHVVDGQEHAGAVQEAPFRPLTVHNPDGDGRYLRDGTLEPFAFTAGRMADRSANDERSALKELEIGERALRSRAGDDSRKIDPGQQAVKAQNSYRSAVEFAEKARESTQQFRSHADDTRKELADALLKEREARLNGLKKSLADVEQRVATLKPPSLDTGPSDAAQKLKDEKAKSKAAKRERRAARVGEKLGMTVGASAPAPKGMDKAALKGLDDIAKRPVDPGTRIDEPVHPTAGVGHGDRPARQEHVPGAALSGPQDARAVPEPLAATAEGGSRRPPETVGGQPPETVGGQPPETVGGQPYRAGDVPLAPLPQREAWGTGLHPRTDDDESFVFGDRDPEAVFRSGLAPSGEDPAHLPHQDGHAGAQDNRWLATTRDVGWLRTHAEGEPALLDRYSWRYDIEAPDGEVVNGSPDSAAPRPESHEVLFRGGVAGRYIRGAQRLDGGRPVGAYRTNPGFFAAGSDDAPVNAAADVEPNSGTAFGAGAPWNGPVKETAQ